MKPSTSVHWEWQIQRAIAFAHSNPFMDISLKKVAGLLNVSKDHFSHKFEKLFGEPYMRFVKRSRLEAGVGYLQHSDFSMSEISERCRYTNAAFSKAIRHLFNTSPTALRNQEYLPAEVYTLAMTKQVTDSNSDYAEYFDIDKTVDITLPSCTLYYNILPSGNDPIKGMVASMKKYSAQLFTLLCEIVMDDPRIITGTLDVVPVTTYGRMMMYVGLLLPNTPQNNMAHYRIIDHYQERFRLTDMQLPYGYYKKLRLYQK